MKQDTAAQDVRLQQKLLAKTAIPLLHILNELSCLQPGQELEQSTLHSLTTSASDALTLLSSQNQRLIQERKNKIVRTLSSDLKGLRKVNDPESEFLFRADVVTCIQTLKRGQQSIMSRMHPHTRPTRSFSTRGRPDNTKPSGKNGTPFQKKPQSSWKGSTKRGTRGKAWNAKR